MTKSRDAFRTISEVAEWLETPAHVLRFWESKFSQVKPVKRAGGRRYYRPADMELLGGIKKLLHEDGMTIKGVQKVLREQGVRYVSGLSVQSVEQAEDEGAMIEDAPFTEVSDEEAQQGEVVSFPTQAGTQGTDDAPAEAAEETAAAVAGDADTSEEQRASGDAADSGVSRDREAPPEAVPEDPDIESTSHAAEPAAPAQPEAPASESAEPDETDIPLEFGDLSDGHDSAAPKPEDAAEPISAEEDAPPPVGDNPDTPELPLGPLPESHGDEDVTPPEDVSQVVASEDAPVAVQEAEADAGTARPEDPAGEAEPAPSPPVSRPVDLPDFTQDEYDTPARGPLAHIAGLGRLTEHQATSLAPQIAALRALRDRLQTPPR